MNNTTPLTNSKPVAGTIAKSSMQKPWLIQRAKIRTWFPEAKVSQLLDLDYMGSSEFEFGTVAKSIRECHKRNLVVSKVHIKGSKVYIATLPKTDDNNDLDEYTDFLHLLSNNAMSLREHISFHKRFSDHKADKWDYDNHEDFWWDLDNHVVWSLNRDAVTNFLKALGNSVKYMDEQAKNKSA